MIYAKILELDTEYTIITNGIKDRSKILKCKKSELISQLKTRCNYTDTIYKNITTSSGITIKKNIIIPQTGYKLKNKECINIIHEILSFLEFTPVSETFFYKK